MTTTITAPPTETETGTRSNTRVLELLGGLSMAAGPLLLLGGALTSPPQRSNSAADYVDSLGNDPWLTAVSANLFHYSWMAFAFAALAAIGLVRGRKGRLITLVSGIAAAIGSIQFSGLMYSDFMNEALDNSLPLDQAAAVFTHVASGGSIGVWLMSAKLLGLLGFPLLFAGLARAGVLSWWLVPLALLPMIALGVIGGVLGCVAAILCCAPYFVTAWRLVQRSRLA